MDMQLHSFCSKKEKTTIWYFIIIQQIRLLKNIRIKTQFPYEITRVSVNIGITQEEKNDGFENCIIHVKIDQY